LVQKAINSRSSRIIAYKAEMLIIPRHSTLSNQ